MSNKNKVEKIVKKIYNKIGEFIFGEDNDRLEKKVVELLKKIKYEYINSRVLYRWNVGK